MNDEMKKELCRKALRRIAWRLQYQAKRLLDREKPFMEVTLIRDAMVNLDSNLFVEELLEALPDKDRFIIRRVVIEGVPEKEVARQLNISQQRVNAYKQRSLLRLREMLTRSKGREINDRNVQLSKDQSFSSLLQLAERGDQQALEQILSIFEDDMQYLACFIKMPREDSLQQMKVAFIDMIRNGRLFTT